MCWGSLLVRAADLWSPGCEFESWQEQRENFLLQSQLCELTLIWRPFHHCVTAVAHKRPQSFCWKCRWQVTPKYAYTLDQTKSEWADYATIQALCGNLSGNELMCNSWGNTWSQSFQITEPLWTDPGLKSGISVREQISTKKKKKKSTGRESIVEHSPKILTCKEKATITIMCWKLVPLQKQSKPNP